MTDGAVGRHDVGDALGGFCAMHGGDGFHRLGCGRAVTCGDDLSWLGPKRCAGHRGDAQAM